MQKYGAGAVQRMNGTVQMRSSRWDASLLLGHFEILGHEEGREYIQEELFVLGCLQLKHCSEGLMFISGLYS